MKIKKISDIDFELLKSLSFDLSIFSKGKDERSIFLYNQILKNNSKRILQLNRSKDDLADTALEKLTLKKNECFSLLDYFKKFLENQYKKELNIAIDYTSMSQLWYSSILNFFKNYKNNDLKINLYLSYSQAEFYKAQSDENLNYEFSPLFGFSNLSIPNKPTALILGVGYEKRMAFSLKEYFDAEEVYVFMTDEASAPDFSSEVKSMNLDLLNQINLDSLITYPVLDILYIRKILFDLCQDLSSDFRVLIAPCGPKTFSLTSAIIATQIENIDIWNISGGRSEKIKKKANGQTSNLLIEYI